MTGGLTAALIMVSLGNNLQVPLLFLMALRSIAAGALWALLPALFKARWEPTRRCLP